MTERTGVAHAPEWITAAQKSGARLERERVLQLIDSFAMVARTDAQRKVLNALRAEVEADARA